MPAKISYAISHTFMMVLLTGRLLLAPFGFGSELLFISFCVFQLLFFIQFSILHLARFGITLQLCYVIASAL